MIKIDNITKSYKKGLKVIDNINLEIKDGEAQISEASCPDQICVNHMHIHYSKEMIVCLPNGLIAEIVNGEERDIDGSTH